MTRMNRREFLGQTAAALGAAAWGGRVLAQATAPATTRPAVAKLLLASDVVTLNRTGIKASRLAVGMGSDSGRELRAVGDKGALELLRRAFELGVRWWDTAEVYKTHSFAGAALKELKRDQVVITSKTFFRTAEGVRADVERCFKALNSDYLDILLLHCLKNEEADWPQKMKGAMDVLSELKAKGKIRAVGVSCHGLEALQAAADTPWTEIVLARINPFAYAMDVDKPEQVPQVAQILETLHARGKAVYGMKIFGAGKCDSRQMDESLRFALTRPYLDGFTIGFSRAAQLEDIVRRIERLGVKA